MAIPIQCPHCQRAFKLKDELAGKRVTCPGCKKPFPVPSARVPSATAPAASKPHADADAFAAAALADAPAVQKADPALESELATIAVKCPFCDFDNVFESRFEGKNQPCRNDDCRKIIKVPLLEKAEAKDWRTVKAKPTLARTDTEQLEGAWGNVEKVAVSREALKEAEAIGVATDEEEDEAPRWRKWLVRSLVTAAVVGALASATLWLVRKRGEGRQERAMEMALEATDLNADPKKKTEKLSKELSAVVCILAAQHDLKANAAQKAWEHLVAARGRLDASSFERQAALIEAAATMADLPGSATEVEQGKRLDWEKGKVHSEIRSTLQKLEAAPGEDGRDMRSCAYRILTRKLAARDMLDAPRVLAPAAASPERAEMLAVIGLELLGQGKREKAEEIAKQASLSGFEGAPSLIALWLAIGSADAPQDKRDLANRSARAIAPPPGNDTPLTPVMRVGYAEGFARQGKLDEARRLAAAPGKADERLRARAAVAAVVAETNASDTGDLDACAKLVEGELKDRKAPPWLLLRLAQISAKLRKPEYALRFAALIGDPGLRAWGQYEALKSKLRTAEAQEQKAEDDWARTVGEPDKLAHSLAWTALARHNARISGSDGIMREITKSWDKEKLKPFGYAGVALAGVPDEQ